MLRILLLRHAQSTWNAQGRWQGRADPTLSPDGRRSAESIAPYYEGVSTIYSSPLLRSRETAEIIGKVLGIEHLLISEDLSERNIGEWTGLTREEVERSWPGYLKDHKWPPSAETTESVRQRAYRCLKQIAKQALDGDALDGGSSDGDGSSGDGSDGDAEEQPSVTNVPTPRDCSAEILVVTHGGLITTVEQSLGQQWRRIVNLSGRGILGNGSSWELDKILERPPELSRSVYEKDSP